MKKHYYFNYKTESMSGDGFTESQRPGFPLSEVMSKLHEQLGEIPIVTYWAEISHDEYVKTTEWMSEIGKDVRDC